MSRNVFHLQLFTFLVLILQSACFICTTWKREQTMEQQPHHTCERTKLIQKQNQVTSHSNWPRLLLFDLAHNQCNGIIKDGFTDWRQSQKEDFLSVRVCSSDKMILLQYLSVSLNFGACLEHHIYYINVWLSMMSSHGADPVFFNEKIKIGRPEHLLTPTPYVR